LVGFGGFGPKESDGMEKFKQLMEEYGSIAIGVYLTIFVLVIGGFFVSFQWLSGTESAAGTGATLGAAWLATKGTQPLRIGATLALTPLVGGIFKRWKKDKE
jgi:hypothetical protein